MSTDMGDIRIIRPRTSMHNGVFQNYSFLENLCCSGLMRVSGSWRVQRCHLSMFELGLGGAFSSLPPHQQGQA